MSRRMAGIKPVWAASSILATIAAVLFSQSALARASSLPIDDSASNVGIRLKLSDPKAAPKGDAMRRPSLSQALKPIYSVFLILIPNKREELAR